MTSLADEILSVALGLERGDSVPAAAGRKLREIAERVREMPEMHECASCGFCYEAWQDGGDNCPVCSEYRLLERIAELEKQLRLNRDGWHKIPPYGYVPDEAQAPYVAGPVAEEPE